VRFKEPQGLMRLASLKRQLAGDLGVEVDLVTEGALSPFIKADVLRDLKIIYGKR
jgi:predicted nucleotidyltransferase